MVHQAALGDFILIWPILAALADEASPAGLIRTGSSVSPVRGNRPVSLASPWSMAQLAQQYLVGIEPISIEQPVFTQMYRPDSQPPAPPDDWPAFTRVISFVSDGQDAWARQIRHMLPDAEVYFVQPRPPMAWEQHVTQWHRHQLAQQGLVLSGVDPIVAVAPCQDAEPSAWPDPLPRRLVVHIGSGGEHKQVSLDTLSDAVLQARSQFDQVRVIAGQAEQERGVCDRWRDTEAGRRWDAAVIPSLEELAQTVEQASVYVGHDTGPTHLAGVLGVSTLALFGPTDPRVWGPLGRRMHLLAPPKPCEMNWLTAAPIVEAIHELASSPSRR